MGFLDSVTKGPIKAPRRTVIYGTDGIGKTTWASRVFPDPILLPTEDGFHDVDVTSTRMLETYEEMMNAIIEVAASQYQTVILDSVDWAQHLIDKHIEKKALDTDYGKLSMHREAFMLKALDLLNRCRDNGKQVIVVGHATVAKDPHPGKEPEIFDLDLDKRVAPLVREWADEVLFCEWDRTYKSQDQGFGKTRDVAIDKGGAILHTESSAYFKAKHRSPKLKKRYNLYDPASYQRDLNGESK